MLSIAPIRNPEYCLSLSGAEDYYAQGLEPPGQWFGKGAQALGLWGTVDRAKFSHLVQGFSPDGRSKLVQNAGAQDRQVGWDFTFSADKSVSVLWATADPEGRVEIEKAHEAAVRQAVSYLEAGHAFSRCGKGGSERQSARLVWALFEHGTSRALDPQLHTHALVLNVVVRADGKTGTLESRPLYRAKMAAGALYRAELAHRLEQLGYRVERRDHSFRVAGVPEVLVETFSKRRQQIENALAARGASSARAAAVATLDTREAKQSVPRPILFERWKEEGRAYGFGPGEVEKIRREPPARDPARETLAAIQEALKVITSRQSHFTELELLRHTAQLSQGRGPWASLIIHSVREHLAHSPQIVRLGEENGVSRFSTREILELERRMLRRVERLKEAPAPEVKESVREAAIARVEEDATRRARGRDAAAPEVKLGDEQRAALRHITGEGAAKIQVVAGMAGTGKTTLLDAAREALERSGYRVLGTAVSGVAADALRQDGGIESSTLTKLLKDLSPAPAGTGQPPSVREQTPRLVLDPRTAVIVDEAGMVGTRAMGRLIRKVHQAGARLILVGDSRQLQSIEAGSPLAAIGKLVGATRLDTIVRQEEGWARKAVCDMARGESGAALKAFAERGLLTVSRDRDQAMRALIVRWKEEVARDPTSTLIFAGTRLEGKILNRLAQAERVQAGALGNESAWVNGEEVRRNDRVLLTENSYRYGVRNGNLGSVLRISPGSDALTVKLDSGKTVTLPVKEYPHLQLGYAVTTHKGQGKTVDTAFVLVGGSMQDREISYVQVSRARRQTHLFTDRLEAGKDLSDLARQMRRSRRKTLAHEVIASRPEPGQGLTIER